VDLAARTTVLFAPVADPITSAAQPYIVPLLINLFGGRTWVGYRGFPHHACLFIGQ